MLLLTADAVLVLQRHVQLVLLAAPLGHEGGVYALVNLRRLDAGATPATRRLLPALLEALQPAQRAHHLELKVERVFHALLLALAEPTLLDAAIRAQLWCFRGWLLVVAAVSGFGGSLGDGGGGLGGGGSGGGSLCGGGDFGGRLGRATAAELFVRNARRPVQECLPTALGARRELLGRLAHSLQLLGRERGNGSDLTAYARQRRVRSPGATSKERADRLLLQRAMLAAAGLRLHRPRGDSSGGAARGGGCSCRVHRAADVLRL